ncbi:presenilin-like protein [Blastocystis sp. subtype 4]|uniref:presenilin-like protein n=1 Tax=Blastocystis sp. subtype 4 TaxID=944170 RepID=UPI000712100D|nr:presenilin-like protein [Blastocystis sp. subtype 4]KNB42162.1 presenilin-like protein [Blastocystis sp. subtype 4]|eukprot:XP_014525605.1 presenilin-like protein [Blastocystis sp. subtype 4]
MKIHPQRQEVNDEKNLLTDSTFVIWYGVNHLSSIVIPVGLTMLISTILVNVIRPSDIVGALEEGMTVYMVYKQEADNTWDSIWQAVVNALVIVIFIGLMTFVMVILYKYHCVKVLYALLYFATFSAIGYTGWFVFYMAMIQYRIPWDLISSVVIFVNLGVVSVVCIFGKYAPDGMKKTFLVFISCLVCYLLSFFPDWTTWVLLVAMALYDMCAVLTPCGPLKMLLNISRDREDAIPGLLYETTLDRSDAPLQLIEAEEKKKGVSKGSTVDEPSRQAEMSTGNTSTQGASKDTNQEGATEMPKTDSQGVITDGDYLPSSEVDEEEEGLEINRIFERESVQLGLGDFIFYSLMVSKASLSSTVPFVFVFIIILSGLLMTMALLSVLEQALPALPFSMLLGVTAYALSYFLITKMINAFVLNGIMI